VIAARRQFARWAGLRFLRRIVLAGAILVAAIGGAAVRAAETLPPAPRAHFNDYAALVPAAVARRLDAELDQFERATSDQVVVAIYPKLASDSSVEDYTVRVAQAWHAGLKGRDNGAVLFVFVQSHQAYLQVGYGLEGAIPDATAKRIIADEIIPRFRTGDFAGGLDAGVTAIMAAARGEYRGTGRTVADGRNRGGFPPLLAVGLFLLVMVWSSFRRHTYYNAGGRRSSWGGGGPWIFPGGGGGGFGGGGGGGGGGGFSGGGGGFGGGGAGGSW
jgi:uncharacterized protein